MTIKKFLSCLLAISISLLAQAQTTRVVGGDLSLVPAYEAAGDKWLDADGSTISDLVTYLKDKGWNSVRLRLFVDPSQDTSDPAVCQDYAYVQALGKRIKDAGMSFMLDFHYSDTWADPNKQKIPASWTDHSTSALAGKLYTYTKETITNLIAGGATPDYVQIGNEITYGLLWNTSDGSYPSNSSQYASAGYCTTWSSTYSTGTTQWRRTASLLNNAAHGVRQAFADKSLDSTQVKIVVHTDMGNVTNNSDNFYRHIENAGFKNYDIIGLSYYPTYHGALSVLGSLLTTIKSHFPSKPVHIVETAWYNNWYPDDATYSISALNSNWTADASGQINYLTDLIAYLNDYTNVTGLYYWQPEECGSGKNETVLNTWLNRGLWSCSSEQNHSMVTSGTTSSVATLATFATSESSATDWTSSILDNDFESDVHFNWDNGPWNPGDAVYLWDYGTNSPYNVAVDEWAYDANTHICKFWCPNAVTSSGSILYQDLSGLPNGTYTLSAQICDQNQNLCLYAGDNQTQAGAGSTSWGSANTVILTDIEVTEGTLRIGIAVDGSVGKSVSGYVDNFTLTQTAVAEEQSQTLTYTYEGIIYTYNTGTRVAYVSGYDTDGLPTDAEGQDILGKFTVDGITYYPSYIAEWALEGYPLYWLTIPQSITVVGKGAFYKSSLYNVTFYTNGSLSIWDYAFTGWDDTLEDLGSKGTPLTSLTIYAESLDNVVISSNAFNADDIAEATLWVVKGLEEESAYTSLGFLHVYPMGVMLGDVNDDGQITIADVTSLVNIILGKSANYIRYAADVNGDGEITIADVTALVNIILGK